MASLNKVILIGNLGRDPEVRYMPNGEAVANFSIATTESYKDRQGEKVEKTEWHNIVMYRKLAEIAEKYLKKGSQIYVEGRLQTRKWQDKTSGQDRYTTEIIANEMKMLGGRGEGGGASRGGSGGWDQDDNGFDSAPAAPSRAAPRSAPAAPSKPAAKGGDYFNQGADMPFDDDIPF